MKLRKEMGEEKKKEKNRAEGSNTNSKNTSLKKTITQHQIFVEAARFRLELLRFRCSGWVAAHLWMQTKK